MIKMEMYLRLFWGVSPDGTVSYSQMHFFIMNNLLHCLRAALVALRFRVFLREVWLAVLKCALAHIIQEKMRSH